jgi:hypothetical protein
VDFVGGGIAQNLDAESPHAQADQFGNRFCSALRIAVEECIAASDVRMQYVLDADAISQFDIVSIAWAAAIGLVFAGREHAAKNAMLHMEHRHVLVDDDL